VGGRRDRRYKLVLVVPTFGIVQLTLVAALGLRSDATLDVGRLGTLMEGFIHLGASFGAVIGSLVGSGLALLGLVSLAWHPYCLGEEFYLFLTNTDVLELLVLAI